MQPYKHIGILLLLLTTILKGFGQSKGVQFLLDTTISIMKANAINADSVDWKTLKKNAHLRAKNISNPYQLGPAIRELYASLNDFHGAFFYKDSMFQWQGNIPLVSDSITNEFRKGVRIRTNILEGNIGYLRIPSMPGSSLDDFNADAQRLNDSLCKLTTQNIKGIILDLRLNGGGAMFPMILGVKQLLPDGFTGSFRTRKTENWFIKDNAFYIDTQRLAVIKPICDAKLREMPVVILTSPVTGSSAEFFIIAFKGRENTVLIGTRTAGYETINNGFKISDSAGLNLAIGYGADRNGRIYKKAIEPDIPLTALDKFNELVADEKIIASMQWIKSCIKRNAAR